MIRVGSFLFSVFCLLFSVLSGCGYTTRSMISNKIKTIYVAQFLNKIDLTRETYAGNKYRIYRPMLESEVSRAVTNRFLFDGNLKPVEKEAADVVLNGELVDFRRDPLRYTANDDVEEYRISIVVNLSLWDNRENKLIWQENNFTGDTTYFTIGPSAKSEELAIADALKDLSRRIIERAVEQW